jgi:hypothetical protein
LEHQHNRNDDRGDDVIALAIDLWNYLILNETTIGPALPLGGGGDRLLLADGTSRLLLANATDHLLVIT